jgi:hypothetical protein
MENEYLFITNIISCTSSIENLFLEEEGQWWSIDSRRNCDWHFSKLMKTTNNNIKENKYYSRIIRVHLNLYNVLLYLSKWAMIIII